MFPAGKSLSTTRMFQNLTQLSVMHRTKGPMCGEGTKVVRQSKAQEPRNSAVGMSGPMQ